MGDQRGPGQEAGHDPGVEPEGVEEGVAHEVAVVLAQADHLAPRQVPPADRPVAQDGALRCSGGARREHDMAPVVGADGCRAIRPVSVGDRRCGLEEPVPRCAALRDGAPQDDRLFEPLTGAGVVQQGHVVGVEEVRDGEQQLRRRAVQQVAGLPALEARVDRDERGAGAVDPEGRHRPLGGVGRPHRHAVAGLDAAGHEGACGGVDAVAVLGVGPALVAVDARLVVTEAFGRGVDQAGDGGAGHGPDPSGGPQEACQTSGMPGWSTTLVPSRSAVWYGLVGAPGRRRWRPPSPQ